MSTQPLTVELAERSYPILFSDTDISVFAGHFAQVTQHYSQVAVVVDKALKTQALLLLEKFQTTTANLRIHSYVFPTQGESLKSIENLNALYQWFAEIGLDRKGCVLAIGGGVVGDLAGFAAATWLRGVDLVQVPSTLLSMVDSSVGGKTGINTAAGKNLVGAFHQPQAVLIHTGLLSTLPAREFSAGMAEVIKYGALADSELFSQLEQLDLLHAEHSALPGIIRRCCAIKATIVRDDERETAANGGRALLNLGHTFGHAIENVAGYGAYLHGEAVAIGLGLAGRLSHALGHLDENDCKRIEQLCARYSLPTRLHTPLALDALLAAMQRDKKNAHGKLRLVALQTLGEAITVENVPLALVRELWQTVGVE